jgi:hypothetical protein
MNSKLKKQNYKLQLKIQNDCSSFCLERVNMKRNLIILAWLLLGLFFICGQSLAVCPQAPNDNGLCDSLIAEMPPSDQWIDLTQPLPYFARLSFYVTHDVINPVDSIAAFVLPLCYTHTNSSKYCSLTNYWNKINNYTNPRSIFRHLIVNGDTIHNWMMDEYEKGHGEDWNGVILDLDGFSHIWITLIPSGSEDQRLGDASHVLLFTMTFKLEDTTTVCVDSCFWPPSTRYAFARSDAVTYIPRTNMSYCAKIQNAKRGDGNGDQVINITDVIYMTNYLFRHGSAPVSFVSGDANCDNDLGILDVVYLINYLYKGGSSPQCF